MSTVQFVILTIICFVLIVVGVILTYRSIDGIITCNKGIDECQCAYSRTGNYAFLGLTENWKTIRSQNVALLLINFLIIIVNIITIARSITLYIG